MFDKFDIVEVPFPFTDSGEVKTRPALVLSPASFHKGSGHGVFLMITTAALTSWPGDCTILDIAPTGLTRGGKIRLKTFTLDLSLVIARRGALSKRDRAHVAKSLEKHLHWSLI